MIDLSKITKFEWDDGNARKNARHGVTAGEAEEVFFSTPLRLLDDARHSQQVTTLVALLLAPLVYAVGLIAPLTPSEEIPSLLSLSGFWFVPMVALAIWLWDRSVVGRISSSAFLLSLVLL